MIENLFSEYTTGEDGLFPDLPFKEYTMKDQDKSEDIFDALGIKIDEKPYFIYITFYVCLAIIKKNIYDATKEKKQMRLFIKYLGYAKKHFGDILKKHLRFPKDFPRNVFTTIPAKYGLKQGREKTILEIETWGGDFVSNFIDDLNSHLARAPGLREALINYL